ncbi:TPA: hypothetical protein ACH75F_004821, partial [Escherichia coli]
KMCGAMKGAVTGALVFEGLAKDLDEAAELLNVINVGIAMFSDDLKKQHVEVTQLDWTPPGQGNMQVVQALDNIADSPLADKIAAANQQALERIIQSHPVLIGFDQAINVVPGMTAKTILHAGPPITW